MHFTIKLTRMYRDNDGRAHFVSQSSGKQKIAIARIVPSFYFYIVRATEHRHRRWLAVNGRRNKEETGGWVADTAPVGAQVGSDKKTIQPMDTEIDEPSEACAFFIFFPLSFFNGVKDRVLTFPRDRPLFTWLWCIK